MNSKEVHLWRFRTEGGSAPNLHIRALGERAKTYRRTHAMIGTKTQVEKNIAELKKYQGARLIWLKDMGIETDPLYIHACTGGNEGE